MLTPEVRLTNSATRRKEPFTPLDPSDLRMYVCGPTVYDRAHLGNARPVIVFDVLYRLLRHVYGPAHVTYVRNITDVDDKIIARAAEARREGETLEAATRRITDETVGWFREDMAALGALEPTHQPRATEYIERMVAMIETLVGKRAPDGEPYAYEAEGHVLFRVAAYEDYGRLSGRSLDDMIAGARVEVAPYKRDPMDFVLWKPSTPDQPGWECPWGRGRPGWHIECSAMSEALLGGTFDIHGGGNDLMFPHHENEIAQSVCTHDGAEFARVWLHNEMLQVEGKKMSKSLGNFFTVRDLLDQGWPGEVIRFVFLQSHYRSPMDWTGARAEEAGAVLRKWAEFARGVPPTTPDRRVLFALADDLNTPEVIAVLHAIYKQGDAGRLRASAQLLGLLGDNSEAWLGEPEFGDIRAELTAQIEHLIRKMKEARLRKDFRTSDAIRDALVSRGIPIQIKGSDIDYRLSMQTVARARDKDAPHEGFLGPTVYHAEWLRSELREFQSNLETDK